MKPLKDYLDQFNGEKHAQDTHAASIQALNRLSGASYSKPDKFCAELTRDWHVRPVTGYGRDGYVLWSDQIQRGHGFIVATGTALSVMDWIRNLFALPVPLRTPSDDAKRIYLLELLGGRGERVLPRFLHSHAGYTVAARYMFAQVKAAMDEATNQGRSPRAWHFAGHSAGGGTAALLAMLTFHNKPSWFSTLRPSSGVTIGASNSVSPHVIKRFPIRWLSLIQSDDTVTLTPPIMRKPGTLGILKEGARQCVFSHSYAEHLKITSQTWLKLIAENGVSAPRGALHTVTQHGWQNYMDEFEEAVFIGDWPTGSPLERSIGV